MYSKTQIAGITVLCLVLFILYIFMNVWLERLDVHTQNCAIGVKTYTMSNRLWPCK